MTPENAERWQELEDQKFLRRLVQARLERGMSVQDVLDACPGMSKLVIDDIENFDATGVAMSSTRRYAKAVGVMYGHRVFPLPDEAQ